MFRASKTFSRKTSEMFWRFESRMTSPVAVISQYPVRVPVPLQEASCSSSGRRSTLCSPWRGACWCAGTPSLHPTRWWRYSPTVSRSRRDGKSWTCPGCPRGAEGTAALPSSCPRTSSCCFCRTTPTTACGCQMFFVPLFIRPYRHMQEHR